MDSPTKEETIGASIKARTMQYILAGFGFVAGLAWNDAIKAFIDHWYPQNGGGLWAKFLYAIAVTLILVIVSIYMRKALTVLERHERTEEKTS